MCNILFGLFLSIIGILGHPSELDDPINTATLVFLTGVVLLSIGLNEYIKESEC